MERMSIRAYAKHRGVSRAAVYRAIEFGRVSRGHGYDPDGRPFILPAVADAEWKASTDPSYRPGGARAIADELAKLEPFDPDDPADGILCLGEAKKRIATYRAELRRLELAERKGEVVPIERVATSVAGQYTACRQRLIGIPSRIAADVALAVGPAAKAAIIEAAIIDALGELDEDRVAGEAAGIG